MVSVICRVEILCSEVISYEPQVLGKNHAAASLQTQTIAENMVCFNREAQDTDMDKYSILVTFHDKYLEFSLK